MVMRELQDAHPVRRAVVRTLALVEDGVYVGLGILLSGSAVVLLVAGAIIFVQALMAGSLVGRMVELLDQILLVLLVIELLYTVQVSFREHGLVAEPFLVVALIAVVRRILVLTAEMPKLPQATESVFRHAILELGLLSVLVLVLVGSLVLLQRSRRPAKP